MPSVRKLAEGEVYQQQAGERLLQLENTGDVPLYVGIRNGQYMIAAPSDVMPEPTYVLTEEQWVRLQQQLQSQAVYKGWIASGLLALVEVVPPP